LVGLKVPVVEIRGRAESVADRFAQPIPRWTIFPSTCIVGSCVIWNPCICLLSTFTILNGMGGQAAVVRIAQIPGLRFDRSNLPTAIDSAPLRPGIESLWAKAHMRLALPIETGACFVVTANGDVDLVFQTEGEAYSIRPRCSREEHRKHLGFIHIHPRTHDNPVGFSDRDYLTAFSDGDRLAVVYNGLHVFALLRLSSAANTPASEIDRVKRMWEQAYRRPQVFTDRTYGLVFAFAPPFCKKDPDFKVKKLNDESCEALGFAWYFGEPGQQLTLVT
jgi:hypothetical protein